MNNKVLKVYEMTFLEPLHTSIYILYMYYICISWSVNGLHSIHPCGKKTSKYITSYKFKN